MTRTKNCTSKQMMKKEHHSKQKSTDTECKYVTSDGYRL